MYPERFEFFAPGIPAPQGSKKHVGHGRMVEMSKKLPAWRKAVEKACRSAMGEDGLVFEPPVRLSVFFLFPAPKRSKYSGPYGPPDLDKCIRAVSDCLERCGVIVNDAHITQVVASKEWTACEPGARIRVERREPPRSD